MKDQDYIKIMDRISKNKIEEAFTWDASANKTRRSIRRLSLGIGAIAAAIAVVIGGIGYNAHREHLANPAGNSSGTENADQQNLFGGHGEIKCTLGNSGNILYSDDEYYYFPTAIGTGKESASVGGPSPDSFTYLRWEIDGGSVCEQRTYDGILLTDGEQLYTYHDGQLFSMDSFGNETFFSGVPWKPCRIQKLSDDWYFLAAFIEDSWIDGDPQPYGLLDKPGEGFRFFDYGDVCSDGKGDTIYYRSENQIYAAPRYTPDHAYLLADVGDAPDAIADWTVDANNLYYIAASDFGAQYCMKPLNPDAEEKEWDCFDTSDPEPIRNYYYFNQLKSELFSVTYTDHDDDLAFYVCASGEPLFPPGVSSESYPYSVTAAELWGDHLPDMNERPLMDFYDTGEHIIFTLPKNGKNGEQIVQVNKETGEYQYIGENYAPEQPQTAEQTDEVQASAEDSTETNFLGGKGKLRLFRHTTGYYLNAEDDTYFYDLSNSMRARKTGGDTEYEAFTLPGLTETDAEQHFFITDGMNLVSLDDVLYEIKPDGSLSEVLSMAEVTEDQYGNPTENIRFSAVAGFSQDASGRPTKLSLYLTGHTIGDPYVPQGPIGRAILDLKTGELSYMESFSTLHETVIVSENAVYSGIMAEAKPQLQTAQLRKYSDGDTYDLIDTSGWDFGGNLISVSEDDGTVTFMNRNSQYCKGNLKDGSCTVIADVSTDILCNILPTVVSGMQKIICTTGSNKRVILCNPDGSDQIILKQAGASAQQLITRGVYIENGVIHLTVAEMFPPASGSQMPGEIDHVITIDGDNVSSYAITMP